MIPCAVPGLLPTSGEPGLSLNPAEERLMDSVLRLPQLIHTNLNDLRVPE